MKLRSVLAFEGHEIEETLILCLIAILLLAFSTFLLLKIILELGLFL